MFNRNRSVEQVYYTTQQITERTRNNFSKQSSHLEMLIFYLYHNKRYEVTTQNT